MTAGAFQARWKVRFNALPKIIAGMERKAALIVSKAALDIEAQAKTRAPVDTGTLRSSIRARRVSLLHWVVEVGADYGVYVEWGTVHMAAQPYFRPAVTAVTPGYLAAMRKVTTW